MRTRVGVIPHIKKLSAVVLATVASLVLLASPTFALAADVIITEFMANPANVVVSDANGEWVELENTTSGPVSLDGWTINGSAISSGVSIVPSEKVVICRNNDIASNGGVICDGTASFSVTNGDGSSVVLSDGSTDIDEVQYDQADAPEGQSTVVERDSLGVVASVDPEVVETYGLGNQPALQNGTPASNTVYPVVNIDTGEGFATIQSAINDADTLDGHTIELADKTFTEAVDVTKELTIDGAGEGLTIIDASAINDYSVEVRVDNVSLQDFTVLGNPTGAAAYGIKVAFIPVGTQLTNFAISNVTVESSKRTGIDLNGVVGATISDVTVRNVLSGNGISTTDSSNIVIENATTENNAWGGLALYTEGGFFPAGSEYITITGLTANEPNSLYVQAPTSTPVTNISAPQFTYVVENDSFRSGGEDFIFYQTSRDNAFSFATALATPLDSRVKELSSGFLYVNTAMSIETAMEFVEAGKTVRVTTGSFSSVVLNGSYAPDVKLIGNLGGETVLDSVDLTGSVFDGLQIGSFTFMGQTASYGVSSLSINGDGDYANLTVAGNKFDGENLKRRAVFINRGFDGLKFSNNQFMNYVDTTSGTLYSVVFVEAQGSDMGSNYVADGNILTNSNLPNFFEAYRFVDVKMQNNVVNAESGRLIAWSQPADFISPVVIRDNEINLSSGTGVGVYYATTGTTTITGNKVKGADNCIVTYDVFDLVVENNLLVDCAERGGLFETATYQELNSGSVDSNDIENTPVGFENNNSLFIETCTNVFATVATPFVNNIGCSDVDAPVMTNINMFVNGVDSDLAKTGDTVRIVADVTDANGVEKVQIWVRDFPFTGEQITSGEMTFVSGDTYEFTFTLPADYQSGNPIQETFEGNYFNFRPYDNLDNSIIGYRNNFTVDNTAPAAPTGLQRLLAADHSVVIPCGAVSQIVSLHPNWDDNTESDFAYYEYTSFNAPSGSIGINERVFNDSIFEYNGSWLPSEGTYGFAVRAVDSAGNKSPWSLSGKTLAGSCQITYDDTAPLVSGIVLNGQAVPASDVRSANCDAIVKLYAVAGEIDLEATISDSVAGVSSVRYKVRKLNAGGCTVSSVFSSGNVTMTNTAGDNWEDITGFDTNEVPTEGDYTIMLQSTDSVGNVTTSYVDITIDNTAPAITSVVYTQDSDGAEVLSGESTNSLFFTFDLRPTDDATRYQLKYWNDISGSPFKESSPWSPTNLASTGHMAVNGVYTDRFTQGEGTHYFSFSSCDALDNCSDFSTPFEVIFDTTAPVAGFSTTNTTVTSPELSGTIDDDTATVEVTVDGNTYSATVASGTWTIPAGTISPALSVGEYDVVVESTDPSGNVNTQSFPSSVEIEAVPVVAVTTTNATPGVVAGVNTEGANTNDENTDENNQVGTGGEPFVETQTATEIAQSEPQVEGDSTPEVLQDNISVDEVDVSGDLQEDDCFQIFGICWYWWLIPTAVLVAILYYYVIRKTDEE